MSVNGTKVITGVVRASFVHVFKPYAVKADQEAKYSLMALIDKNDKATIKDIKAGIKAAIDQGTSTLWGGKEPKKLHIPLRDGDDEKDTEEHPEYEGMMFFNASSKRAPGLIDRHKQELFDEEELKSGDYVKLSVNFYPYSVSGSNGIAVGLNNVMKWKDGEALGGGRVAASTDFDGEFDDDEGEEDMDDIL